MEESLNRHRLSHLNGATASVVRFGDELQRLRIQREGVLLRPTASGLVGGCDQVAHRPFSFARLLSVVSERFL